MWTPTLRDAPCGRSSGRGAYPKTSRPLTAGRAHVPLQGRGFGLAIDDEIMALRLAQDRLFDRPVEGRVIRARAQGRAQIGAVLLAKAHVELARAGHAHAVAALAEIMSERRDEADPAAGLSRAPVARRPAGAIVDLFKRKSLRQTIAHLRERQI